MKELLVVVDMQNDFIDGVLGTSQAQAIVSKICGKIENWQGDIIMTMDEHDEDCYLDTLEGRNLPIAHCIYETNGWLINKDIKNAYDKARKAHGERQYSIIHKDSFGSTSLVNEVEHGNYDRDVLCGLCTDICVISNAMLIRGACPDMDIIVDAARCAGVTPEAHETALNAMTRCNIKVINRD